MGFILISFEKTRNTTFFPSLLERLPQVKYWTEDQELGNQLFKVIMLNWS